MPTRAADFPRAADQPGPTGSFDNLAISKLSPTLDAVLWTTFFEYNSSSVSPLDLVVLADGRVAAGFDDYTISSTWPILDCATVSNTSVGGPALAFLDPASGQATFSTRTNGMLVQSLVAFADRLAVVGKHRSGAGFPVVNGFDS